jgi:hypothetical protein
MTTLCLIVILNSWEIPKREDQRGSNLQPSGGTNTIVNVHNRPTRTCFLTIVSKDIGPAFPVKLSCGIYLGTLRETLPGRTHRLLR